MNHISFFQIALFAAFGGTIAVFNQNISKILIVSLLFILILVSLNFFNVNLGEGCVPKTMNYTFFLIIFKVIVLDSFHTGQFKQYGYAAKAVKLTENVKYLIMKNMKI